MRNTKPHYTAVRGLPANSTLANNTGDEGPALALTAGEMRSHLGLGTAAVTNAAAYDPAGTAAAAVAAEAGTRAAADAALTSAVNAKLDAAAVGANNGVAPLDAGGKVAAAYLPSFVDDVLEAANLAAFPVTGETGKIYVAIDTGKTYRWSGSAYVEISASPGSTDAVTEGATNQYFTPTRVRAVLLTGLSLVTNQAIAATDSVLLAIGYLGARINALWARSIAAGTGLSGGGDLSADRTISLANTAVTPGSYTNANVTVDAQGRLTAAANGSSGGGVAPNPGYRTGYYYSAYPSIAPLTLTIPVNRLHFVPFCVVETTTWTKIGINVTTLEAAKSARLGIYNSANGVPTSLVLDAGTVSIATTGEKEATISQQLTPGWYWLGLVTDSSTAIISAENGGSSGDMVRVNQGTSTGGGNGVVYLYQTHAFAALPANAGTLSDMTGASNSPRIWLRK